MSEIKRELYTFEDWKEGRIPIPEVPEGITSGSYRENHWKALYGGEGCLNYWRKTADPPQITASEYKRILGAKARAWDKAASNNARCRLKKFELDLQPAPADERMDIISLEIRKIKAFFDKYDLLQEVKKGNKYSELITPAVYGLIHEDAYIGIEEFKDPYPAKIRKWIQERREAIKSIRPTVGGAIREEKVKLFVATEQYKYLQKLEELLSTVCTDSKSEGDAEYSLREMKELPTKCLNNIQEITEKHSKLGVNDTFQKAYELDSCQYEIVNGDKKKIGSWSTLRNRVKKNYPELYEQTKVQE